HWLQDFSQEEGPERWSVGVKFHSFTGHDAQVWAVNVHVCQYHSADRSDALWRSFLFLRGFRERFRNLDSSIASLCEEEIDYFEERPEGSDLFLVLNNLLFEVSFQFCKFLR